MEEAIIVGIGYSKGSKGPSSRVRDFTPSKAASWKLETGGAEHHFQFIRDEVIPFIEIQYRAASSARTYVGNSLGGLLTLNSQTPSKQTKVYLSVGSQEKPEHGEGQNMVSGATNLAAKIDKLNSDKVTLKFTIIDDAKHATAFPTTLIQGLDWIYGK